MKKEKEQRRQAAYEIRKKMTAAKEKALLKTQQPTMVNKVIETKETDGEVKLKLTNDDEAIDKVLAQTAPGFKKIVRYLLKTDVNKHSRYCPCCRNYEDGGEIDAYGMS